MFLLAKLIILTSILVLGYTSASQPGMVLYPVRLWAEKQNSKAFEFLLCHWCASSVFGLFAYLSIWIIAGCNKGFTWNQIAIYPFVVCGSSVLNGIVWATYKMISEIDQYYRNENEWVEERKNRHAHKSLATAPSMGKGTETTFKDKKKK